MIKQAILKVWPGINLSEYVFDILDYKFEVEEYVGVDNLLKSELDYTKYISTEPMVFKEHKIMVKKMLNDGTKVTFRNVLM